MLRKPRMVVALLVPILLASTQVVAGAADDDRSPTTDSASGTWRGLYTLPHARYEHSCDYDPVRDRMLIHGGWHAFDSIQDAWGLSLGGTPDWTPISPSGTPPALSKAAHIYDPVRDRWIQFSGSTFFQPGNATYALSLGSSPHWTQLAPGGVIPTVRDGAVAVYDRARDRMIVFGGSGGVSNHKNDVQALDLVNTEWSEVNVAGTPPSPRSQSCAIYDGVRDRLVVFGGRDSSASNNEVWTVDLSGTQAWTLLTTLGAPPAPRYAAGAAYDSIGDRMIVFGGTTSGGAANDTWSLSLATGTWSLLVPGAGGPPARVSFGSAYDSNRRQMLVFGGQYEFRDTWALSLADPTAWTRVHPGIEPGPRFGESATVDVARDRLVVFGGATTSETFALELGPDQWELLQPAGGLPEPRRYHSAIHDILRDRMIIYGGSSSSILADMWSLSFDSLVWNPMVTSGPSPGDRSSHSAVYDPVRQRMLLFGGGADSAVYALHLATSTWTKLTAAGNPGRRASHAAIYDPVRDRMLIVGGNSSGPPDMWALSLSGSPTWSQLATTGSPPDIPWPWRGAYDSVSDRMIIYGGDQTRFNPSMAIALTLNGTPEWTPLAATPLSTYVGSQIAYDPARNRILMHGGGFCTGLGTCFYNTAVYELSFAATLPVPEPVAALRTRLASIRPNPARDDQSIVFEITAEEGPMAFEIYAVSGQRVWSRNLAGYPTGTHTLRWNGADAHSRRCAPGVYWASLRTRNGAHTMRFVRIH